MKDLMTRMILTILALAVVFPASAETNQQPKTLAATIGVYVFPTEGQDSAQQSKDEAACYEWAVQNTGTDPFELARKAEQQRQQAEQAQAEIAQAGRGAGAGIDGCVSNRQ